MLETTLRRGGEGGRGGKREILNRSCFNGFECDCRF